MIETPARPAAMAAAGESPRRFRPRLVALAVTGLALFGAAPASAEIVYLTSGRTLSVKSYAIDGDAVTLSLRAGGTMTFPRSLVERIAEDEVDYPEPAPEPVAGTVPPQSAALTAVPDAVLAKKPYADLISTVASSHGVDAKLVHAVVEAESNYQARARSPKGARGLMQLMPETARQYAVRDPYDPRANLDAGVRHLKDLLSRLDLRLALAAYNAGEAVVRRYDGVPPFPETRSYVQRILARVGPPSR